MNIVKKSNQKLKLYKNEITQATNNKCENQAFCVAYYKTQKAITLIVLVITIIVLLILAGVTINLVLGPEGLLKQAQDAVDRYKQAENEELNSMSNILAQLDEISNGNNSEIETPIEPDNPPQPIEPDNPGAGEVIKTENNIKYTSDGEGNEIPVPVGFSYLEGTKESGFVIKNDKDLNEFVWIPTDLVPYMTYEWEKARLESSVFEEYYTSTSSLNYRYISDITNSVMQYKGYYIGRYEAGLTTKRTSKTESSSSDLPLPLFRASSMEEGVYAYTYLTWADSIYVSNKLYSKTVDNVDSRLINGRSWDTALKFIATVGNDKDERFPNNAREKAWDSFEKPNNPDEETGKPVNINIPNKLKNIYDLAGNVSEYAAGYNSEYKRYMFRRFVKFRQRGHEDSC